MKYLKTYEQYSAKKSLSINELTTQEYAELAMQSDKEMRDRLKAKAAKDREEEEVQKPYSVDTETETEKKPSQDIFGVITDVAGDITDAVQDGLTSVIDFIPNWISRIKEYLKNFKGLLPAIWKEICLVSKEKWNDLSNFLFQKNWNEVEVKDINFDNIKRISKDFYTKTKEFFTDKSWSFKEDLEKLESDPEAAVNDKSLRLKTIINSYVNAIFKRAAQAKITSFLIPILGKLLIIIGIKLSPIIIGILVSIIILLLFVWLSKKQIKFEIKLFKDLDSVISKKLPSGKTIAEEKPELAAEIKKLKTTIDSRIISGVLSVPGKIKKKLSDISAKELKDWESPDISSNADLFKSLGLDINNVINQELNPESPENKDPQLLLRV
jgi:hypothetical protein